MKMLTRISGDRCMCPLHVHPTQDVALGLAKATVLCREMYKVVLKGEFLY
jgi:hypothetical protein